MKRKKTGNDLLTQRREIQNFLLHPVKFFSLWMLPVHNFKIWFSCTKQFWKGETFLINRKRKKINKNVDFPIGILLPESRLWSYHFCIIISGFFSMASFTGVLLFSIRVFVGFFLCSFLTLKKFLISWRVNNGGWGAVFKAQKFLLNARN